MKYRITGIFIFFIVLAGKTQTNSLSLEDAMLKARTTLAPENLKALQFIYGTNDYVYLKKIADKEVWVKGNSKDAEKAFLTLEDLNIKLKVSNIGALESMPSIQFNKNAEWVFMAKGSKIALNPKTNATRILVAKEDINKINLEESASGNLAYLHKENIYIKSNEKTFQVTKDGSKDLVYGASVHREEFGISKGLFWSNDGKKLAFYRMDQSMVADYPIIDWSNNPAINTNIKYPMAGGTSHHVTVGIYHTGSDKIVYMQTGLPAEQYLTNICWNPDNQSLYIAIVNREQDVMQLNEYNSNTGALIKTLFTEKDEKYTEPQVPMFFLTKNPNQFIWQSNRDGFNQLYLYETDGKLIKQITNHKADVLENKGLDAKGETIFYTATDSRGLTKKLYSYHLKKGITTLQTTADGVHNVSISTDGMAILDSYSNRSTARIIHLLQNNKSKNLLLAPNPLREVDNTILDFFAAVNRHGDTLNVKTYYPPNYNTNTEIKYPAIVYWYGGPHAQMVTNSWNAGANDYWFKYMAQQGYVVIVPDTRGSDNRGKKFEQAMFREAGKVQMEDLEDVLALYNNAGIDKKRMGLFGWSYGGFMTTNFILNHPGIFKAAVAGGPVMDWSLYEIMYTERYMDTPKENPKGYEATNLVLQAGKLKDKLLLIHGLQDPVVVQQHSVNFVKAAISKGAQVDYMIYPEHEHNVTGKDRLHLYQKITDYFKLHLK